KHRLPFPPHVEKENKYCGPRPFGQLPKRVRKDWQHARHVRIYGKPPEFLTRAEGILSHQSARRQNRPGKQCSFFLHPPDTPHKTRRLYQPIPDGYVSAKTSLNDVLSKLPGSTTPDADAIRGAIPGLIPNFSFPKSHHLLHLFTDYFSVSSRASPFRVLCFPQKW